MKFYRQSEGIQAFQKSVLGFFPLIMRQGTLIASLAGSEDQYRSLMIGRQALPTYGVEHSVMLLSDWPIAPAVDLGNAIRTFAGLDYDTVFNQAAALDNRPMAAVRRLETRCVADHRTVVNFQFWREADKKIGCFFRTNTSDLIGSFASDYLMAQVFQHLIAELHWYTPGPLLYQGALHIHPRDIPLLQEFQSREIELDWNKSTQWGQALAAWDRLLDTFHAQVNETSSFEERFKLLQMVAGSIGKELSRGGLNEVPLVQ